MSEKIIIESDARFTFDSDRLYLPEEEPFQQAKLLQGVKVCDFLYLSTSEQLLIAEVKTTAPQISEDLDIFVRKITSKFLDSLLTYVGAWADRPNTQAVNMPQSLRDPDALRRKIRLVLIITHPEYDDEWLPPVRNKLQKQCRHLEKMFSLGATQVYTLGLAQKKLARKYGFQISHEPPEQNT